MSDYQQNKLSAQSAAKDNITLYQTTSRKFGKYFDLYRKDIPLSLCVAHVVRVNPKLSLTPVILGSAFKRGFTMADTSSAREAGFYSNDLDKPEIAAYIWCREINRLSKALQVTYPRTFTLPEEDFWKFTYLKHVLGAAPFNRLWEETDLKNYESLVNTVAERKTALTPWPITTLKKLVFFDCEYVYALAQINQSLISSSFGSAPTLRKNVVLA